MPLSDRRGQGGSRKSRGTRNIILVLSFLVVLSFLIFVAAVFLVDPRAYPSTPSTADVQPGGRGLRHPADISVQTATDAKKVNPTSSDNTDKTNNAQPDDTSGHPLVKCIVSTSHATQQTSEKASGVLLITVRPDLAPQSSAAFLKFVSAGYYDGVYIHRVVKNFIAQFGIHPDWKGERPQKQSHPDPVLSGKSLSNVRATLSFAGGNVRLGQVFVNLGHNSRLDKENGDDGSTRPFATLDEDSMVLADMIYTGYKEGQGQVKAVKGGAEAVAAQFPEMSRIDRCRAVS